MSKEAGNRKAALQGQVLGTQGSNTVPREDSNSLNIYHLTFLLYTCLSCSTNTGGVLLCSTRFIVLSGTGFLCLAVNRQGTIVYNLPSMPPVIYWVIFQLAVGVHKFTERPSSRPAEIISSYTTGVWVRKNPLAKCCANYYSRTVCLTVFVNVCSLFGELIRKLIRQQFAQVSQSVSHPKNLRIHLESLNPYKRPVKSRLKIPWKPLKYLQTCSL